MAFALFKHRLFPSLHRMIKRPLPWTTSVHMNRALTKANGFSPIDNRPSVRWFGARSKFVHRRKNRTLFVRQSIEREELRLFDLNLFLESVMKTSAFDEIREAFEFVDVPLPACFDLSKPFQSDSKLTSNASSLRVGSALFLRPIHRFSVRSSQASFFHTTIPPNEPHRLNAKYRTVKLRPFECRRYSFFFFF